MFHVDGSNFLVYTGRKPRNRIEALKLSIKKWEFIVRYGKRHENDQVFSFPKAYSDSCGLCMLYIDGPSESCTNCPIFKKTGQDQCRGTSFYDYTENRYGNFDAALDAAKEMVKLLKSLLKEYSQ